jgi:hypothetical protein
VRAGDIARASRRLTRRTWGLAAAWGVALAVIHPFIRFDTNFYWAHWSVLSSLAYHVLTAWAFLVAIVLADASAPAGRPTSMGRYMAAIALAAIACAGYAAARAPHIPWAPYQVVAGKINRPASTPATNKASWAFASRGLEVTLYGGLGAIIFVVLRNGRDAARALEEAELKRSKASERLLASRLEATRAQIDPEVTLRELERIEALYERDPNAADALMDELIVRLREAIPLVRLEEGVT